MFLNSLPLRLQQLNPVGSPFKTVKHAHILTNRDWDVHQLLEECCPRDINFLVLHYTPILTESVLKVNNQPAFQVGPQDQEMAQWVKALYALAEDPGSTPSIHMAANKPIILVPANQMPLLTLASMPQHRCTQKHASNTLPHIK